LKFVGAAAAVLVGGATIGYLIGEVKTGGAPSQPVAPGQPVGIVSTPPAPAHTPDLRPHPTNGNYTAPNAPRIVIHEEQTPILRRVSPTPPPTDSEASQETGLPVTTRHSRHGDVVTAPPADGTGTDAIAPPVSPDAPPAPPADGGISAPPADGGSSAPPAGSSGTHAPPAPPADPDFERGGGQPGGVTPNAPASSPDRGGKAQKAQFRVQTGSYTDESNARSVADDLRGQGYTAHTRSERDGDHLVYKVQAGAYRSRSGASKAADDLQKKGFPAYVSPITP